ncbi:DUF4192 family protein [Paenarthrobacter sp. Z7-10]|nr:DUF4192 family protein [Paenarthrobacter sp. Z7-10]
MEVWELAMARWPAAPDAAAAGFLLASLESLTVRDAVLVSCSVSVRLAVQGAAACGLPAPITPDVFLPEGWDPTSAEREFLRTKFQAALRKSEVCFGGSASGGPATGESEFPGSEFRSSEPGEAEFGAGEFGAAEFGAGEFGAAEFGAVLMGETGNRPDWCRMDVAARLLEYLAEAASGNPQAAALTMLGWISWCRGRASAADGYLRQALNAMPGYRLAGLLRELVGQGNICGWAKRRSTAWRGADSGLAEGAP